MIERYHQHDGLEVERASVHAVMHAAVENQIAEGDRYPVRRTLLRLMAEGLDRHEAIHAIASVLAGRLHELLHESGSEAPRPEQQSDRDVMLPYFSELEKLTAEDWLRSG